MFLDPLLIKKHQPNIQHGLQKSKKLINPRIIPSIISCFLYLRTKNLTALLKKFDSIKISTKFGIKNQLLLITNGLTKHMN